MQTSTLNLHELLVHLAQHDSESCWTELMRREGALLNTVCQRELTGNAWTDDAVQEAALAIQQHIGSYHGRCEAQARAWLIAIVRNRARNLRASEAARVQRQRSWAGDQQTLDATPQDRDMDERVDQVRQAMLHLPENQRRAVELRYFYDLSDDAAAARLGLRPGHVRVLIHRGLQALRTRLGQVSWSVVPVLHEIGRRGDIMTWHAMSDPVEVIDPPPEGLDVLPTTSAAHRPTTFVLGGVALAALTVALVMYWPGNAVSTSPVDHLIETIGEVNWISSSADSGAATPGPMPAAADWHLTTGTDGMALFTTAHGVQVRLREVTDWQQRADQAHLVRGAAVIEAHEHAPLTLRLGPHPGVPITINGVAYICLGKDLIRIDMIDGSGIVSGAATRSQRIDAGQALIIHDDTVRMVASRGREFSPLYGGLLFRDVVTAWLDAGQISLPEAPAAASDLLEWSVSGGHGQLHDAGYLVRPHRRETADDEYVTTLTARFAEVREESISFRMTVTPVDGSDRMPSIRINVFGDSDERVEPGQLLTRAHPQPRPPSSQPRPQPGRTQPQRDRSRQVRFTNWPVGVSPHGTDLYVTELLWDDGSRSHNLMGCPPHSVQLQLIDPYPVVITFDRNPTR